MDDRLRAFFNSLNGLVESISVVNEMLREDRTLFNLNKTDQLQISNQQKQVVLHNVAGFTHDIQQYVPQSQQGFLQSLLSFVEQLQSADKLKANKLIEKLQDVLNEGTQHLATNNHIIMMNLNQIKNIWDRLTPLSLEKNSVYERPKQHEFK